MNNPMQDMRSTNPLVNPQAYHEQELEYIYWEEVIEMAKERKRIKSIRMKFVSDYGYPDWDLSYWHIEVDGQKYEVLGSPFYQVPKRTFKTFIYNQVKKENIFIHDLFGSTDQMQ